MQVIPVSTNKVTDHFIVDLQVTSTDNELCLLRTKIQIMIRNNFLNKLKHFRENFTLSLEQFSMYLKISSMDLGMIPLCGSMELYLNPSIVKVFPVPV